MSRSSVLVAFVALASFAGCAPENAPAIEARTELLDGGIIATPREWHVGNWCTADEHCMPVAGQFDSYAMDGVDIYPCVEYECRVFDYAPLEAIGVSGWGRCFVRLKRDASLCPISTIGGIDELMLDAKSGASSPHEVESLVPAGVGVRCTADSDECPNCVDGVCCESDCHGGSPDDCFACSVDAGGARDGLCTPVLTLKECSGGVACVRNERCVASLASDTFSGLCKGESTAGLEIAGEVCCIDDVHCPDDSDGDKCTVPACVDHRCIEKLAYEGCCVSDAQCDDGNARTCDRCVETGRLGWKICESVESSSCADAGVVLDASVVFPDLGEWPRDASTVVDAALVDEGVHWDWDASRDAATRMDGQVARDARIDDADVVIDAEIKADAEAPDASADAAPVRVTPIFRGGGGIRCAVSGSPGAGDNDDARLAGMFGLAAFGWLVSRRRR